ncbi:MAG: hypothetical protein ACFFAS_00015 [Promethearchaeota archaeon]
MNYLKTYLIRSGFLALATLALVLSIQCVLWGITVENQASTGVITFVEHALRAQFCLLAVVGSAVFLMGVFWGWIAFEANEKKNKSERKIDRKPTRSLDLNTRSLT